MKKILTTIRCEYSKCGLDVPVFQAATLEITTVQGVETYKGHKKCMEALDGQKEFEYYQNK